LTAGSGRGKTSYWTRAKGGSQRGTNASAKILTELELEALFCESPDIQVGGSGWTSRAESTLAKAFRRKNLRQNPWNLG
jgi:hypothetical protein